MIAKANEIDDKNARIAGALYLVVVATGLFSLLYVPSVLTVPGDVTATVSNIAESELLFRSGILASALCYVSFLLLPLVLYRLLGSVNRDAAVLMVAFAVASVPISMTNLANRFDVLSLVDGAWYAQALTAEQVHAHVRLALDAYNHGLLVSEILWGLWLLPFGYLVFRSGFLPRILGILLMAGCFGYVINFAAETLFPPFGETAMASLLSLPSALGEIGTCLWLLLVGVRKPAQSPGSIGAST